MGKHDSIEKAKPAIAADFEFVYEKNGVIMFRKPKRSQILRCNNVALKGKTTVPKALSAKSGKISRAILPFLRVKILIH
jgi:hypothetical protein